MKTVNINSIGIPMLKITRSCNRLSFNMGHGLSQVINGIDISAIIKESSGFVERKQNQQQQKQCASFITVIDTVMAISYSWSYLLATQNYTKFSM